MLELIRPDWPAPGQVRACSTTRRGGFSTGPFWSLNLAFHVGDDPDSVRRNRRILAEHLDLPGEPAWLEQVHGCTVADASAGGAQADASFTDAPGVPCVVLTADCLPVLLCNRSGTRIAAVHAGWKGLAAGVLEAALDRFADPRGELLAWMGPAIGPRAFEVGEEVREAFLKTDPGADEAFAYWGSSRWLADLFALGRRRLERRGVGFIGGGEYCTVSDADRFYSYRRDGVTGRMASLIWIDPRDALNP